jgi:hypothetical protein
LNLGMMSLQLRLGRSISQDPFARLEFSFRTSHTMASATSTSSPIHKSAARTITTPMATTPPVLIIVFYRSSFSSLESLLSSYWHYVHVGWLPAPSRSQTWSAMKCASCRTKPIRDEPREYWLCMPRK